MIAVAAHAFLGVVAAGLALTATPLVRRLALRLGAVDVPGPRRIHQTATPRLGGLAVLAGAGGAIAAAELVGFPVVATLRAGGWHLGWLAAGIAVVTAAGAADDLHGLGPRPKLVLEIAAGALALAGGYALHGFTHPLSGEFVALGVVAGSLVTLAWILLVTNALNLIDGLDGLAAGVALIASLALLVIAWSEGRGDATLLWVTLAGALAGFLVYNFNPASIFLGDSGSLLLGYLLAVLSLQSLQKGATTVVVLAPVLALGLPIADVMLTIVRRALATGVASVWQADRGHIHHQLLGRGLSQRGAVLALYGVCTGLGALAFAAVLVQGVANAAVVALAALVVAIGVRRLGYDARGRRAHLARDREQPARRPAHASGLLRDHSPVRADTVRSTVQWEWIPRDWPAFVEELEAIVAICESRPDRLWLFRGQPDRRWLLDSTIVRSLKTDVCGMTVTERFTDRDGLSVEERNDLMGRLFLKLQLAGPSQELLQLAEVHGVDPHYEWLRRIQQHGEEPHPEFAFGANYPRGTFIIDWSAQWDIALFFANVSRSNKEGALWIVDANATGNTVQTIPVIEIINRMTQAVAKNATLGTPLIFHPGVQTTYQRVERQKSVYVAQMEPGWDLSEVWAGLQDQAGNAQIILKVVLPAGSENDCRRYLEERGITNDYIYPDESQPVGQLRPRSCDS